MLRAELIAFGVVDELLDVLPGLPGPPEMPNAGCFQVPQGLLELRASGAVVHGMSHLPVLL